MYLIPKGIGEQTAESVLGVSYPSVLGPSRGVQCLNCLSGGRIYTKDVIVVQSPSHLQLFATP